MNRAFLDLCKKGNLEEIKKFYFNSPTINIFIFADSYYAFLISCEYGHLDVAKWLLKVKPDINISVNNECAFRYACVNGHLEVAKWLLKIKPDINISANNEFAFIHSCEYGHLEIAKWLLEVKPDINISAKNDLVFQIVCQEGYLDVAKWLLEVKPDINIYNIIEDYCNDEIKKWLKSLKNCNNNNNYFKETIEIDNEQDCSCSICITDKIANCQTNCGHNFCKSCIEKWMENKNSCPMCRNKITKIVNLTVDC